MFFDNAIWKSSLIEYPADKLAILLLWKFFSKLSPALNFSLFQSKFILRRGLQHVDSK